jgi:hypothetical protein
MTEYVVNYCPAAVSERLSFQRYGHDPSEERVLLITSTYMYNSRVYKNFCQQMNIEKKSHEYREEMDGTICKLREHCERIFWNELCT